VASRAGRILNDPTPKNLELIFGPNKPPPTRPVKSVVLHSFQFLFRIDLLPPLEFSHPFLNRKEIRKL
jgi:hypothetical protein